MATLLLIGDDKLLISDDEHVYFESIEILIIPFMCQLKNDFTGKVKEKVLKK